MMTEVLHQRVRPRRSAVLFRESRRNPAAVVLKAVSITLRTFRRENPAGMLSRIAGTAVKAVPSSVSLYLLGLGILLMLFAFIFAGAAMPVLWAGGAEFSMPRESEIEFLLQAYVEPPASEILEGAMEAPDTSRFAALSLSSRRMNRGETVSAIAAKAGLHLDTVVSLNRIQDVRRIPAGAELKLPNQNGILYTIRRGDSLSSIGKAFNVGTNALADVNSLESSMIHPGQELFIPGARMPQLELRRILGELFINPSPGRLTSTFGLRNDPFTGIRRFHNGIDIAGPIGTPVSAAMAGKIVKIGVHPSFGRYIIMSHSSGYQTWYAHLQRAVVKAGVTVAQGELIGEMGNTGYSTGSHLHFSVFKNGSPVDPMQFLR